MNSFNQPSLKVRNVITQNLTDMVANSLTYSISPIHTHTHTHTHTQTQQSPQTERSLSVLSSVPFLCHSRSRLTSSCPSQPCKVRCHWLDPQSRFSFYCNLS